MEFISVQDLNGRYLFSSPAALAVTGFKSETFYKNPNFMDLIIHPDDLENWNNLHRQILNFKKPLEKDLRIKIPSGQNRWIRYSAMPVFDDLNKITGIRSTSIDITLQKIKEEETGRLADFDVLTGLPNRRMIKHYLDMFIEDANFKKQEFAIIFLDLDRFKYVNDSHGHSFGDKLLVQLSNRFFKFFHPRNAIIGRFGGDEFIVLLPPGKSKEEIRKICIDLVRLANEPFIQEDMHFSLGASLGIALYPHDGKDAESLIKNADAAMFKAKRNSDDSIHFFSAEIGNTVSETFYMESKLREAINKDQFDVYYQPIVDLKSGQVIALEALARWKLSDDTIISPEIFIPLVEDMGKIHILDLQIAEKSCRQLRKLIDNGFKIKMSINISARLFKQIDFCENIFRISADAGIDLSLLKLELTESALIEDIDVSINKIEKLRESSAEIAIDDFGTGFSSLRYLTYLPINILKIDRSFIASISENERNHSVVEGILNLSKSLGISVIAEGIENEEQLQMLKHIGCEAGQGFLFAKPMPAEKLENLLRKIP